MIFQNLEAISFDALIVELAAVLLDLAEHGYIRAHDEIRVESIDGIDMKFSVGGDCWNRLRHIG